MPITREYLNATDWGNVLQTKAPLKWVSQAFDYLLNTVYSKQSAFYSKLVRPSLVKFNTTFFNYDFQRNSAMTAAPLNEFSSAYTDSLKKRYMSRLYGMGGIQGQGSTLSKATVAVGDGFDIVAFVKFKTVGEIKNAEKYTHVTEPVLLSGYTGRVIDYSSAYWDNFSCVLTNEMNGQLTLATEYGTEYDNWVVPFVSWFYRVQGQDYPRQKKYETSEQTLYPFVAIYSDGDNFWSSVNDSVYGVPRGDFTFNFPLYLYLKPAFSHEFDSYDPALAQTAFDPLGCKLYEYLPPATEPGANNVNEYTNPPAPYKTLTFLTDKSYTAWHGATTLTTLKNVSTLNGKYFYNALSTTSWSFRTLCAYKTKNDFINFFNDWGIPCTENEDDALNKPMSPVNPDTPSDPPVTEIPSYPDDTTDTITINTPDYTASSFGQCKIYTPSTTLSLIEWLGTNTFWQDINRLFANPIDAVFGLRMYNIDIVQRDTTHTTANAATKILNVSTDIPNYGILNGYNTIINGGNYRHTAYYGNFADYLNTTYDIYIPYVGIRRLNPSDVVNRTLQLQYAVDFSTGDTTVFLLSDNKLIMATSCNISAEIPLQTSNINDVNFKSIMGVLTGAVSGAKTGFLTGSIGGAIGGAALGGITGGLDNYLNSIEYGYQGGISGNNSYALVEPFLIIRRFPIANVGDYQQIYGLANASTVVFSSLTTGYVKTDTVEINTRATDRERDEIIALLKNGVHLK